MNLVEPVSRELGKKVSKNMLRLFLKKLQYGYRRIRKRLKGKPDAAQYASKKEALDKLLRLEKQNFITVFYCDESGFNETPCIPYGWQPKKESLSVPAQSGRRCNVFGLMSRANELFTYTGEHSINSAFIIESIDDFVKNKVKQPSVIVLDNAKVHHSAVFKSKIAGWKDQQVDVFYLPTYSPHLNLIEAFWRKCKYEWLEPRHFESWLTITQQLDNIFKNFGSKFNIKFADINIV